LRANVNTLDEPLTHKADERPIWSEQDIGEVAAFFTTLHDDYDLIARKAHEVKSQKSVHH
jgi:cytochrome c peroxidase